MVLWRPPCKHTPKTAKFKLLPWTFAGLQKGPPQAEVSQECASAKRRQVKCQFCGGTFVRKSGNGRYCSDDCRLGVKRRDAWINHLRGRYGLTQEAFDALRAAAGNKCEVCGAEFKQRGDIHVDHDHGCCPGDFTCGECIRGLTCKNCNFMLGHAGDDPQRLQQGIDYLHRFDIEEPGG